MSKSRVEAVQNAIFSRRSVRSFQDNQPVSDEALQLLLEAGMAGPSACNLQPWEYVVVREQKMLDEIRKIAPYGDYNAPLAIIVCANTEGIPWEGEGWMIDCGAAVENMMLLAAAMGLGSVWIGEYGENKLRELFLIPPFIHVMNLVYFGYPREESRPKTRFNPDAVHDGQYDVNRKRTMRRIGDPDNAVLWRAD